jgi:hypothetical protein
MSVNPDERNIVAGTKPVTAKGNHGPEGHFIGEAENCGWLNLVAQQFHHRSFTTFAGEVAESSEAWVARDSTAGERILIAQRALVLG